MGPLYDQPRETLTKEQVDASLRYQIMEVVDQIRWIPDFGYERELDWLRNMHDWMISKKRYWGLALPIYDCSACGTVEVIGGREELQERAVEGWDAFEGHTPHRPYVDAVKIACPGCGAPVERIKDVGNPWLDAGIVPFSTLHYREDPEYWRQWFPADFITESFPGQFRNWFYSMLAMSTVLRREPPFKTIFGYALAVRRGRPADAQELGQRDRVRRGRRPDGRRRHALDVRQGPARGEHPVRLARGGRGAARAADPVERLLVLRHVRAARRLEPDRGGATASGSGARSTAGSCPARQGRRRTVEARLRDDDAVGRRQALSAYLDGLSTWYLRLSRRRFSRSDDPRDQDAAFATLHEALVATARMLAPDPAVPRRVDLRQPRHDRRARGARQRPPDPLADRRAGGAIATSGWSASMAIAQAAVDLARTLRSTAGLKTRQPLATAWLALPDRGLAIDDELLELIARRDQRQGGRAHRRRFGARRAAGQAAAAEDRQEPRVGDPRRDGRRPRRATSTFEATGRSRSAG